MFKKRPHHKLQAVLLAASFLFLSSLILTASSVHAESEVEFKDDFCDAKLKGTSSLESCSASCPGGARNCSVIQTHKAQVNRQLNEDLSCYGCVARQTCYDMGYIYEFPDCINCEMNPFKKCVKAMPVPLVGASVPLPKDSDGLQCWDCIDDPDTCWKHWPGSTEKAACEAGCKKPNHKCVKVGVNPDNGFGCYKCMDLTPPPSCNDRGFLYRAQCNTCPPDKPKCEPVIVGGPFGGPLKDAKGEQCYQCAAKPKSCEEQGLRTACAADEVCTPTVAPNGANCCTCEKKPKTCADYGMQNPPCECGPGENVVERAVDATPRQKINCCKCEKDACYPNLKYSDCKDCEARGGRCTPMTTVRGQIPCYYCWFPPPQPKSCQDLKRPASCSPNPCSGSETCQMVDMGYGFKCADCVPNDDFVEPNNCENHPTHKFPNCAPCFNAQMSCEQIKVSDTPPLFCAKCMPPTDQRCPEGLLDGSCGFSKKCVDGTYCVDVEKNCHLCLPPEECVPGRYREPNCKGECDHNEECQRIEGCVQQSDDPRDAAIEQIDPEGKYCGPDITEILLTSLNRIRSRVSKLPASEKGAIDGTMFLNRNGMSIDLRAVSLKNSQDQMLCPSKPCMAGSMKTVMLCGQCVMEHIGNDILYGFISNQLDVPFTIQLAGAHYAEYTSYGGLDPLPSQAAYRMGNDASETMKKRDVNVGDLCSILNGSRLRIGVANNPSAFELMAKEQPFLSECTRCPVHKVEVLKDFSTGTWSLEKGRSSQYPQQIMEVPYDPCCFECVPKPETQCDYGFLPGNCPGTCAANMTCLDAGGCHSCEQTYTQPCADGFAPGACPGTCRSDQICAPAGENCHSCQQKPVTQPLCPQGYSEGTCPGSCSSSQRCLQADDKCYKCENKTCHDYGHLNDCLICDVEDQDCIDVNPAPGLNCKECLEPPKTTPQCPQGTIQGACTQSSCSSGQECVPAGENCHRCQKKKQSCEDMGMSDGETCMNNCVPQGGKCTQKTQDDYGTWCWECSKSVTQPQCPQGQQPGTCPGSCSSDQNCIQSDNNCYSCQEKPRTAGCPLGTLDGPCPAADCPASTHDCYTDPEHSNCHFCEPKIYAQPQCPQGQQAGVCPGSCSSQQTCVQKNDQCYACETKKKSCEDMGMSDGEGCMNSGCIQQGGKCVQKTQDDYGTWCWECQKTSTTGGCNFQNMEYTGVCPGNCSEDQECYFVSMGCYKCKDKPRTNPCVGGSEPGGCFPNPCYMGQLCAPDESGRCHTCVPMDTGPCVGKGMPGPCPGYCNSGEECVPSGNECHFCREKTRTQPLCNSGLIPGSCPGTCTEYQNCVEPIYNQGCHYCEPKPVTEEPVGDPPGGGGIGYIPGGSLGWKPKGYLGDLGGGFGYIPGGGTQTAKTCAEQDLLSNCYPCRWQGAECVPAGNGCFKCERIDCGEDYRPESWCEDCEEGGGYCVPAPGEALKPGGPKCFDCVDYEECEDYGMVCSCMACPFGTTACVPTMSIDGQYGPQTCYACLKNVTIEITYAVVVIEGIIPRYVLKDAPAGSGSFVPSSVMALMKVDMAKLQQLKKLAEMAKGGIKSLSFGNIQEITGMLQQNLGKKKTFSQDCFSDFSAASMPKEPPAAGPAGGGKKGASSAPPSFGKDEREEMIIDGPVVACGKLNGKDALSIFDASGTKVASMLKEQMLNSPGELLGSFQKAQAISEKFARMRNIDPKNLAKEFASQMVDRIFSPRKADPKKEGKVTSFDPNDPLYYANEGKPKSKVKERMKKVVGQVFDTTLSDDPGKKTIKAEDQWGIRRVGYLPKSDPDSAWNVIDGQKENVVVAIIDSGYDATHPDGPQYIWKNPKEVPDNKIDDDGNGYVDDVYGWNFLDDNNDLTDYKGHGTFVAGIIAAKANNGIGIAGINPGAVIMPLKVGNAEGEVTSLNIYRAIIYATDHGAKVINVSLGSLGVSELEQSAIRYALSKGVFVAIAGGNVGENIGDHGPASTMGAFITGALDRDDKKSPINNWGPNLGLVAPSEQIYSLRSKDSYDPRKVSSDSEFYYTQSGTSFSTPMVAATASLMLAKNPHLTNTQIEDILHATADDMAEKGWDGDFGAGILNASQALRRGPEGLRTLKLSKTRINKDKNNKIESVDVFATVRGEFSEFTVEVGKGKDARSFKPIAGPFTQEAVNSWVARIDYADLKGSDEWVVRLNLKDKAGAEHAAQSLLVLEKRSGAQKHNDLYYGN